ncbi:MAG TPA: YceK/YidQ family lipoprotein [Pseudomonadales bacterium]|nr:YceK/YidQ family lipoprotein [Pseudomonadales bacterium]
MKVGFQKVFACLLPILFLCGGCATELTHTDIDDSKNFASGVYRGTRTDATCIISPIIIPISPGGFETISVGSGPGAITTDIAFEIFLVGFGIIDLPLSATADTLILPYDLTTIHRENSKKDSDQ